MVPKIQGPMRHHPGEVILHCFSWQKQLARAELLVIGSCCSRELAPFQCLGAGTWYTDARHKKNSWSPKEMLSKVASNTLSPTQPPVAFSDVRKATALSCINSQSLFEFPSWTQHFQGLGPLLRGFLFLKTGSHVAQAGLNQIHCVAKDEFELLIFLPPPFDCWD